jgi:hypothetical protein
MSENPDRIERTLELLLYAPIGIGLFLKDTAPTFVNMFVSRGKAEVDRRQDDVQQRVTTARSLGQVALAFGPPVIRKKVEDTVAQVWHHAEGLIGSSPSENGSHGATAGEATVEIEGEATVERDGEVEAPEAVAVPTVPTEAAPSPVAAEAENAGVTSNGDLNSSAELPIPGYDALSASQVVQRLTGLTPDELDAVQAYEATHRQRRTILGKIEQLAG